MAMISAFALFALTEILLAFKRRCGIERSPAGDRRDSRAVAALMASGRRTRKLVA
jgi:hypothetical protein